MKYEPTIGLEIHVELKTKSKMFCDTPNGLGLEKEPNVNICPVCTGQPGVLPVINEEAVHMVLKTGLALNAKIAEFSKFDRKNYFYPDLPKGYQISQYDKPLVLGGHLDIIDGESTGRIQITRVHLEEDTGKLVHPVRKSDFSNGVNPKGADYSLVDLNRAGVPLMELVTEPDIKSGSQARKFCQELQLILRYLGVSDADMEKGQMRCEVNISLREIPQIGADINTADRRGSIYKEGIRDNQAEDQRESAVLGTKVEIKNLNSFRAVEKSINYEIKRQAEELEAGGKIIQETRGWDDAAGKTVSQRTKEEAHDYRYFPEPDLPPLVGLDKLADKLLAGMPELPRAKKVRLAEEYVLSQSDIEVLIQSKNITDYFENVCSEFNKTENVAGLVKEEIVKLCKLAVNYLITEIPRIAAILQLTNYQIKDKITAENFAEFIILIHQGKVSSSGAQAVLAEMFKTGADPTHIIEEKDLGQVSDEGALRSIAQKVIENNQKTVVDYKKGHANALQFLVGQVMKESRGRANPNLARDILTELLK